MSNIKVTLTQFTGHYHVTTMLVTLVVPLLLLVNVSCVFITHHFYIIIKTLIETVPLCFTIEFNAHICIFMHNFTNNDKKYRLLCNPTSYLRKTNCQSWMAMLTQWSSSDWFHKCRPGLSHCFVYKAIEQTLPIGPWLDFLVVCFGRKLQCHFSKAL